MDESCCASDSIDLQRQLADVTLKNSQLEVHLVRLKERNHQLEVLLSKHGIPIPDDADRNSHDLTAIGEGDEADLGAKEAAVEILTNYAPAWQANEQHRKTPPRTVTTDKNALSSAGSSPHVNGVMDNVKAKAANSDAEDFNGGSVQSTKTSSLPHSPTGDANQPKLQLHLQYNEKEEQLAVEVLQGEQLAVIGVLDFSKIFFKFDLVPGRLISARSGNVMFSPNTPLNATVVLSVRQTSLRWKKLVLTIWSVPEFGSEACMGTGQVELKDLHKDQVELTPWVDVIADESEGKKKEGSDKKRAVSSSVMPNVQAVVPEATPPTQLSQPRIGRRHTVTGVEGITYREPTEGVPPSSSPQRLFQKRRMAAAVMQAARSANTKERKLSGTNGTASTPERKSSWSRPTPVEHSTPSSKSVSANNITSERKSSFSRPTPISTEHTEPAASPASGTGMVTAVDDDDIPDIRSLNRSRTGDQSLPSTPLKKAVTAFQSPLTVNQPRRASLGAIGRAASVDSLISRRGLSGASSTEDLKTVVRHDRIVKEVLAEEQTEQQTPEKELASPGGEPEETQFLQRLNQLRSSQRKKPEGLSFREKQAFFRTASVDIPDAEKPKK